MSLTEIDKTGVQWFTPESQIGDDNPLQFKIKPLTGPQLLQVLHKEDLMLAISFGLKDWKGYLNVNGSEVKFKSSKLDGIPTSILSELSNEIVAISSLTGDEIKN